MAKQKMRDVMEDVYEFLSQIMEEIEDFDPDDRNRGRVEYMKTKVFKCLKEDKKDA
jgi:hypothetical protein